MLEYAFMQRALAAALVAGLLCGALGFFVVLRRLAFIGVGISHSAIAGVAIGLLAGIDPVLSAAVFAVIVALAVQHSAKRGALSEDTIIGVFFSGSMALGLLLLSLKDGYRQDLFAYLFGDVLSISANELLLLTLAAAAILLVLALFFREMLLIAFDEEIARAYGRPVDRLDALLLVLLAVTVIVGVRLVGILLIEALLVIPAATAALWTINFRSQLALAASLGSGTAVAGLALSWRIDTAAGPTMVVLALLLFLASLALRPQRA